MVRLVMAWGDESPSHERARELALALQRTGRGATWTALVALAEDEPLDAPLVDPAQLTPAERAEAERLVSLISDSGLAALSDVELILAECLRRKLEGAHDLVCFD